MSRRGGEVNRACSNRVRTLKQLGRKQRRLVLRVYVAPIRSGPGFVYLLQKVYIEDCRKEFVEELCFPAIQ